MKEAAYAASSMLRRTALATASGHSAASHSTYNIGCLHAVVKQSTLKVVNILRTGAAACYIYLLLHAQR